MTISRDKNRVWLGMGGNIGQVIPNLAKALRLLDTSDDINILRVSSIYKTPPWGKTDQPWFYNICVEMITSLAPEALLVVCQEIEIELKRTRDIRWGPRTLDIDILIYQGIKNFKTGKLVLPHPRMHERAFVLLPLAEIAPKLQLDDKTVDMLSKIYVDEKIIKLPSKTNWW